MQCLSLKKIRTEMQITIKTIFSPQGYLIDYEKIRRNMLKIYIYFKEGAPSTIQAMYFMWSM